MNKFAVALAALLLTTAASAAPFARDLRGHVVDIDVQAVAVTWSMDCLECRDSLRSLERMRQLGVPVVAINTDPPSARNQVAYYLLRHGMKDLPVVQMHVDQVADNTPLLLSENGQHVAQWVMSAMPRSPAMAQQ